MRVPRKAALLTAAAAAACVALSACATTQLGAAAITGNSRITTDMLTNQVANLNHAYTQDRAKNISPQRATGQEAQQVLTWLITFRLADQMARQNNIHVSAANVSAQQDQLNATAGQNNVTVPEYVSAGGALPPDLTPQLARYFAILSALEHRLTGGKNPATQAQQTQLNNQVSRQQCLASKSLGVRVNPQYGQFDYNSYSVVARQSTLAADPSPSRQAAVKTSPPC